MASPLPHGDPVRLWRTDGLVVGRRVEPSAGLAVVPLRDGVFVVDPLHPSRRGQLRIAGADPGPLVEAVFGAGVADLASAAVVAQPGVGSNSLAGGDVEARAGEEVAGIPLAAAADTPERAALQRLAVIGWLARWSILPLDHRLLTVEALLAQTEIEALLDDRSASALQPAWDDWAPTVIAWARRGQEAGSPLAQHPGLGGLLAEALAVVADHASKPDLRSQAGHLVELIAVQRSWGLSSLDPDAALARLGSLRAVAAASLGAKLADPGRGVESVDWARITSGVVDWSEDAVVWTLASSGDAVTLEVSVGLADADPARSLLQTVGHPRNRQEGGAQRVQASLYHPQSALPLAVLELTRHGGRWLGRRQLGASAARRIAELGSAALRVDVTSVGIFRRPREGVDARIGAAVRWSARATVGVRLAAMCADERRHELHARAAGAFVTAARLFRASTVPEHLEAAHRCAAAARELVPSSGVPGRRTWSPGAPAARPAAPVLDLAARPTVAEQWYAAHLASTGPPREPAP